MTAASCSWELSGRREDFATWLCWHGCDVRTGLTTCRNVCFQASFSSLIKTTQACLASPPAEPQNCIHVPRGRKRAKPGDAQEQNVTRLQQWAEGMAAGWHQVGTAPASPAARFTTCFVWFGKVRHACEKRDVPSRLRCGRRCWQCLHAPIHGAWLPTCPCSNTHSIQSSAPCGGETQRLDFPAVEVLKDQDYTKRRRGITALAAPC